MKRNKVIFQAKLVVGHWELIPVESGAEFPALQDTATVRVAKQIPSEKKQRNNRRTEENSPSLKKALVNSRYPAVRVQCDEACLQLRFDPVPKQTVFNFLQRIGRKLITYENTFPRKNKALLSESQVKYMEYIIVTRDTANPGVSRGQVIQFILYIGQANSFVHA